MNIHLKESAWAFELSRFELDEQKKNLDKIGFALAWDLFSRQRINTTFINIALIK